MVVSQTLVFETTIGEEIVESFTNGNYRKKLSGFIGLSYKVTVILEGLLIQSDRASPYKLTVDKLDYSQGLAQPRAATAMDC